MRERERAQEQAHVVNIRFTSIYINIELFEISPIQSHENKFY